MGCFQIRMVRKHFYRIIDDSLEITFGRGIRDKMAVGKDVNQKRKKSEKSDTEQYQLPHFGGLIVD